MKLELAPLPYASDALAPYVSAETLEFHYGKHHRGYVDKVNQALASADLAADSLESLIHATAGNAELTGLFNAAAQSWNHEFFWNCMKRGGGGEPEGELASRIDRDFGSLDAFKAAFKAAATGQFGSGWAWLVRDGDKLEVVSTSNAELPMTKGQHALLTCDVWEHAYYIDYRNDRGAFVDAFLNHLVNWEFAAERLAM